MDLDLARATGALPDITGYILHEPIGEGGSGTVHRAWQESLKRWVAVKWIPAPVNAASDWFTQLRREALATSSLSHPNVVKVYDVGHADGAIWLAMEWVDGVNLRELLAEGPLDLAAMLDITRQIVAGLRHAHQRGVIHRDVTPSNILVGDEGHVWVADFGIASSCMAGVSTTRTSQTFLHAGAAAYMPPERLRGLESAAVTEDVYSLAAVVYEMLMGTPPLGFFQTLSSINPAWASIDRVMEAALAPDPLRRPSSIDDFWEFLQRAATSDKESSKPDLADARSAFSARGSRAVWVWLALGMSFFFFQAALIGFSAEEQFSFPAGPGTKLYDAAVALTSLNCLFLLIWFIMTTRAWRKIRHHPDAPSLAILILCMIPIVVGIITIVYLAVSD